MADRLGHRQGLDALRTPLGRNLPARYTPYLLGVVLEKCAVEPRPESIDEEIFEGGLGTNMLELGAAVA